MVNVIEPMAVAEVIAFNKRRETPFRPTGYPEDALNNPNGY